ncbi:hypothetical protein [Rathayibacter sp. VKM Ac-2805]|uniref:hypothetical protein n=1 Tax=Rathayibacter sp. VKM Ac-2805 TaxID=2609258 RepID=UPI00131FAC9C|nr:hypothetical protein [Rathayibacter sp. VKM Ac-2805]QHC72537.1 hypothetical protein GSU40_01700 [Rathayibacter sp. VKM Ac-2805]
MNGAGALRRLALGLRTGAESTIRSSLASTVALTVDSGARAPWPQHLVTGRRPVAEVLTRLTGHGSTVEPSRVNNGSGVVLRHDGRVVAVVVARTARCRIAELWVVTNPDKLSGWKPTRSA